MSPQSHEEQWTRKQKLEKDYERYQQESRKQIDPVTTRAVKVMEMNRFINVEPTYGDPDITYTGKTRSDSGSPPCLNVAQSSVTDPNLPTRSRFAQTTPTVTSGLSLTSASTSEHRSLFHAGVPPEDFSHSIHNFLTVSPVDDPNVLFARIAVKGGCVRPGYVPPLPQPREGLRSEGAEAGSERGTYRDQ